MNVPLSGPDITKAEIDAVLGVMESEHLSIGPRVEAFEQEFVKQIGVKHAIAVNSGTSGLHCLVKAMGIGPGDEVITTPYSFVASTNCVMFENATPVFVDIDPRTFNLDLNKVEAAITPRTKAILPVDVFGQPMDMETVNAIAKKHNLLVLEDSCEALGAQYKGIKAGSNCDGAVFAFYPNKQITTAEGGMIVTNNDHIADLCRSYRSQGRAITGFWLEHERMGFNYRLSELHAALGEVQMKRLDEILDKRQGVADKYTMRLKDVEGVTIPWIHPDVNRMSWFVYVIQVAPGIDRDKVMNSLKANNVGCRPYFTPIHVQPYIQKQFGVKAEDYPVSADIGSRSIALPFFNKISDEQIDYVVASLREAMGVARQASRG